MAAGPWEWYRTGILERYDRFHAKYQETFGERPPEDVWPRPEDLALRTAEQLPLASID